jgi:hypothetical protein
MHVGIEDCLGEPRPIYSTHHFFSSVFRSPEEVIHSCHCNSTLLSSALSPLCVVSGRASDQFVSGRPSREREEGVLKEPKHQAVLRNRTTTRMCVCFDAPCRTSVWSWPGSVTRFLRLMTSFLLEIACVCMAFGEGRGTGGLCNE